MDSLHRYCLSIAGISIAVETDLPHTVSPAFQPFLTDISEPDFRVRFCRTDLLPALPSPVLHEDSSYRVYPDGRGGYLRAFFDAPRDYTPYAVASCDESSREIRIAYLEKGAHCVSQMRNSFFHLGLESLLLQQNRLCLHASCVQTSLGGILFSGNSGIGKSTQSDLWCRYRNARLINGDRPILYGTGESWLAWGSPYAGSSRCHINESCPVSAIVMLRQEKQCTLRRLDQPEAFRAIWSGLTMNSWNETLVERAVELTMDLIRTVPVYEFGCTPDARAVDYLERELGASWNK